MPDPSAPPPDDRDLAGGREQLAAAERRICAWDYLKVLVEPDLDDLHLFVQEYDRRGADLAGLTKAMAQLVVDADVLHADLAQARDRIAALEAEQARTVADCGLCRLGARIVHVDDDCPQHGEGEW